MGDALQRGADVSDEDNDDVDTIDGGDRFVDPTSPPVAPSVRLSADHPALETVERRHYQIGGELAKGGMGRVLEARDLRLGRNVAIKELLPRNRDIAGRFEREARITARLQHPSIIHVYEAGVWPSGEPFYAMPRIAGRSLDKVAAECPTLNERLGLLPTVIAVADALAYAHNENVIHRAISSPRTCSSESSARPS
jgi:serine/threonine protein kinase